MKQMTCDICLKIHDLSQGKHPSRWATMKLDFRHGGNIGGALWKFDLCSDCASRVSYLDARENALRFIRLSQKIGNNDQTLVP